MLSIPAFNFARA